MVIPMHSVHGILLAGSHANVKVNDQNVSAVNVGPRDMARNLLGRWILPAAPRIC